MRQNVDGASMNEALTPHRSCCGGQRWLLTSSTGSRCFKFHKRPSLPRAALNPHQAVLWASFFNFIALFSSAPGCRQTVGSGMIALEFVTPVVILAGLVGAVGWG